MPNIDASGLRRIGRSMDYSTLLKIRKNSVLVSVYSDKVANGFANFSRDQKTRGFDSGIVTTLFEKGLTVDTRYHIAAIVPPDPYYQDPLPQLWEVDGGGVAGQPVATPVLDGGQPTQSVPPPYFSVGYIQL
jgi:hypothetical protein